MVQTRSAAKKPERARGANANGGKQQGSALVELVKANDGPPPAKKPRREKEVANKEHRRRERVEQCILNLDVLFLIAAYIHPLDLLNLARTCKSLRELLMDRSSAFAWKIARRRVKGLPPCPDDLTEPAYANLVVYDHCHGCDKHTTIIMWNVRHRYCPGCRMRRLRPFSSCDEVIRVNGVLPTELTRVKKKFSVRVDKDQAAAFMEEYHQSSDKAQFIIESQKQCNAILQHAQKCKVWQEQRDSDLEKDKERRKRQRRKSIFRRLDAQGYSDEIRHFGSDGLRYYRERDFRSSKPLTDKEWEKILPKWVELMNKLRLQRLYAARRREFGRAYSRFVTQPSSDAPTIELLPHETDVARFPRFREILGTPEEILENDKSFTSAFEQLPVLAAEWKKKLDAELAQLVKIPHQLCPENVPKKAPRRARQSPGAGTDKLRLACAVFQTDLGVFDHLEVFSVSMSDRFRRPFDREERERLGSIRERFGIQFMEEAPFIVHACGLDPSVATVSDMDDRNARLRCLSCDGGNLVMNWRHAILHASRHKTPSTLGPRSNSPHWLLIDDEHIDAIQAAEQSLKEDSFPTIVRCLLCNPRVGDALRSPYHGSSHMSFYHKIELAELKQGVHYASIGLLRLAVEIVEEGGQVIFRAPSKQG